MVIRGLTIGYFTALAIALVAAILPIPDNNRGDSFLKIALLVIPILLAAQPVRLILTGHPEPTRQLLEDIRRNFKNLLWAVVIYFSLALCLEAFSGIKKSIPFVVTFYADPVLIDLDRILFLGTDPWRLSHMLLGWSTSLIVSIYNAWHFVHLGLAIWIAFSFDEARKIQFALTIQFVWLILGGLMAMLLASVGPVMVGDFYQDESFDPLLLVLRESAPTVVATKDILIATMDDPLLVSGISAMPSIHVAIGVLAALWLQSYRIALLTWAGWSYALAIYVGSIHLGWHYSTDGLVSAPLVVAMWWISGKYVSWLKSREFTIPPLLEDRQ